MKIAMIFHWLLSDWNDGNAHRAEQLEEVLAGNFERATA